MASDSYMPPEDLKDYQKKFDLCYGNNLGGVHMTSGSLILGERQSLLVTQSRPMSTPDCRHQLPIVDVRRNDFRGGIESVNGEGECLVMGAGGYRIDHAFLLRRAQHPRTVTIKASLWISLGRWRLCGILNFVSRCQYYRIPLQP